MKVQDDVIARAKGNLAVSKLIPLGEYLDLVDAGILITNPTRYQALAVTASDIIKQFRESGIVRQACQESTALMELLENVDFSVNAGPLAESRAPMAY